MEVLGRPECGDARGEEDEERDEYDEEVEHVPRVAKEGSLAVEGEAVRDHLEHELEGEENGEVQVELLEPPAHLHLEGAAARRGRREAWRVDGQADGGDDDEQNDERVPHLVARDG